MPTPLADRKAFLASGKSFYSCQSETVCCERGFIVLVEFFLFCELACEESGIDRIVHGA